MLKSVLVVLMLAALGAPATTLHLTLVDSSPKPDAVLTQPPREIVLRFNERLDTVRRAISLRGPAGAVALGRVRAAPDTMSMMAAVLDTLAPGEYTISWLAAGAAEGHAPIRGRQRFTVAPKPARE